MIELKYPHFSLDRILKIEMLENFRDFPRDVLEIHSEDLSDGVICGLSPTVDEKTITFSKGIIKHGGELYLISPPPAVNYEATDAEVVIKITFLDSTKTQDYTTRLISIDIDKETKIAENEIEIGRFKLKEGAHLRSDYTDLEDFITEYNTINVVNVLYAGYKETTLSHLVLKYFARQALETRTTDVMDINFCMLCLNNTRIEKRVIQNYIAYKLEEELVDDTNSEMHHKLVVILNKIQRENKGLKPKVAKERRIIVD